MPGKISAKRSSLRLVSAMLVWLVLALFSQAAAAAEGQRPKRVLALYWYGKDFPSNVVFDQGLRAAFRSAPPGSIEYYAEYLESDRFPGETQALLFRDYLRSKYSDRGIDVLVALSDVSLDFLLKYRNDLFPKAPIVYHTFRQRQFANGTEPPNLVGVVVDSVFRNTLDLALKLHPGTEQVLVITATPERDKKLDANVRDELKDFASKVHLIYLTDLPLDEVIARVKSAPPRSIIFYVRYSEDEPGKTLDPSDALALIAETANVPVYHISDTGSASALTGRGGVGGYAFSLQDCANMAGRAVLMIANGTRPQDIPLTKVASVPMFDYRQLKRWGISEDKLPAGSIIRFKEPTFWERYKWRIISTLALFALQSLLIVVLLVERYNLKRARAALTKSEDRNRAILQAIPDLMFFQSKDGTYLDCHVKDPGLLPLPPDQFLGKKMQDVLPPQLCDQFDVCFEHALETKETQLLEYSLAIEEEPKWFEARVAASSGDNLLTIVRDITESRRAGEALRESESRFSTAFNSNPQPMTLTTLDAGCFIDVNQSFLNMSGYKRDEIVGRTAVEPNIWETPDVRAQFLQQLRESGSVRNMEMRLRTKGGALRIMLLSAELVELAGQSCILVSTTDITERKQSEQLLSELTARLLRSQDEERRRIARELHDVTAQSIGLILLNLAYVNKATSEIDSRSKDKLAESVALGEQALKEIRTLSYVLHPPLLDHAGLVTALQWYAKGFTERSGIKVDFAAHGNDGHRMPPDVEYSLFRVVQECLTNIRRHTNSETARITLTRRNEEVVLEVRDYGTGLRLELPTNGDGIESVGVGISGMRHRLKQLGGELAVDSAPNGTTVTATIPVKGVIYDSHSVSR